ncbi:hypothetical protein K1719_047128 [Acacia pycnantha]|nr:hypothetical protein K1719_047128 [Acacia pycnantha]
MAPKVARITSTQETFVQSKNVSESSSKARWNDSNTETFLKVCVEEVEAGNRPHTHFIKDGWTNIVDKFNNITRKNYDKKQLKNRWDALKHEFSMWAKFVENETGLGWDSGKNTIMAPPEWWEAKGKEDPKYLNWKEQGPKFLSLMETCFKDVVATGYVVFKPRKQILPPEEAMDNEPNNDSDLANEGVGEGDTEEHPLDHNQRPRKRKRGRKGEKRQGIADKLQHSLDRILENMDQVSQTANDPFSMSRCLLR